MTPVTIRRTRFLYKGVGSQTFYTPNRLIYLFPILIHNGSYMQKLEPHNQFSITEETVAQIMGAYFISSFTFKPINEGIENTSLVIVSQEKKYVLRIYAQNNKSDADINFEIKFQDYLRAHAIPIPVIYPNTKGEELNISEIAGKRWQTILMEFVEGQSVTIHPSTSLISELANLQARIHLLGIEFAKNSNGPKRLLMELYDSIAPKIQKIQLENKKVLDFIARVKSYRYSLNPNLPHGYNHLDIDFDGNVLTKDNKISGIVDFDDLKYSPLVMCLGYSLWNILDDEGIDAMRVYLSEYEKVRQLSPAEYEALPNIIFFRNYVVGMIRLLLWDEATPITDIEGILRLEKEIPLINFHS